MGGRLLGLTLRVAAEIFIGGMLAALGAAAAGSIIALFRFIRRQNDTLARVEHRQAHVLLWVKRVAQHLGIHFPVDPDFDEDDDDIPPSNRG